MSTADFFRSRLDQMIDLRHPLAVLATRLPWAVIEAAVAPYVFTGYSDDGRPTAVAIASTSSQLPGIAAGFQPVGTAVGVPRRGSRPCKTATRRMNTHFPA